MKQQARPWNSPLVVFVVVFCLVLATGTFVVRELNAKPRGAPRAAALAFIPDWKALAAVGHFRGRADAPVRVVLFADYQCPGCAELHRLLAFAADSMLQQLQVVTRHYPLSSHTHAQAAANAAECAAEQGQFEAFENAAYSQQDSIGHAPWQWFAARSGIPDSVSFGRCVTAEKYRDAVNRDRNSAQALRLPGTPVYIVNGQPFFGAPSLATLIARLRDGGRHAK